MPTERRHRWLQNPHFLETENRRSLELARYRHPGIPSAASFARSTISEMNYLTTGWWPIRPGIPFGRNENDRLGVDDFAGCDPRSSFLQPDFDYVDILALLL